MEEDVPNGPILLYDGVCALCNRMVRFILDRDSAGVFRFAALQSDLAREILLRHGRQPGDLNTAVIVLDRGRPAERLVDESSAAAYALRQLPGVWRVLGTILRTVPVPLRNVGYRLIARTRYRIFGKYDVCPLPLPEHRGRFLETKNYE